MRPPAFLAVLLVSLTVVSSAHGYPWPVRPFAKAHPVRGNFGDPRTLFQQTLFQDGLEGEGDFSFHNGIDISAPDGTSVYPVMSGTVKSVDGLTVTVRADENRTFQYVHIVPLVTAGDLVVAGKTVLGDVAWSYGHVHLDEIRGTKAWNPLAKDGIAPYRDTTKPRVTSILIRGPGSIAPLGICGTVSMTAEARDTPQLKVPGNFADFPVSPALVTWTLRKVRGAVYQPMIAAADFRTTLPVVADFWRVYARGTYQNAPRFGNRQFTLMPGRFLYSLNEAFDTRTVPNGVYQITVRAEDIRGNHSAASERFTIVNQLGTDTGCPPPPPEPGG